MHVIRLMQNIKIIFVDLFGVLIGADNVQVLNYVQSNSSKSKTEVYNILFGEKCMELERSEINFHQYFQYVQYALDCLSINYDQFRALWQEMKAGVLPMASFVDELRAKKYKLFILTNTTQKHIIRLKKDYNFFNKFNGIITSDVAGHVKPSAELFSFAVNYCQVQFSECAFIDDSYMNIRAAQDLGMVVHQYSNYDSLSSFVAQF
ncbi:MAG: hypothetical protein CMG64_01370 [Candidatus Marinimicrobia bacterium]|nr:hypothetical protein [Candidatus Neomarinimicrobiota bacterium]